MYLSPVDHRLRKDIGVYYESIEFWLLESGSYLSGAAHCSPGETLTSLGLAIHPGGKGLNQSVALAKAGAEVFHAGQIGEDGEMLRKVCADSGADVRFIRNVETRTGNAIIQVDTNGQNCIILYPGANRCMEKSFIDEVLGAFSEGDYLLLQNEINNLPYIIDSAYAKGMKIILNPSPMDDQVLACDLSKYPCLS